ncbi:TIGR00730 family Rossman fold protein [Candidatus Saccharibacteria bacterium]|nr:TIGR00730 family Rossman fold protein [Candidatus Saccharibacteria bacterium]
MLLWVQCGANDGIPEKYVDDCQKILDELMRDNDLIFGAVNHGIMGYSYRSALKNGRKIIGSSPKVYEDDFRELECSEEITTEGILESTEVMIDRCDAIVVMPGGFGTLYEFFLVIQKAICGEFKKKVVIYNSCGFFDDILKYLDRLMKEGFISEKHMLYFSVVDDLEKLEAELAK